jgi:hypothetical protein
MPDPSLYVGAKEPQTGKFTGWVPAEFLYVTALSGLPAGLAEIAGGFINRRNAYSGKPTDPPIDASSPHGLSWHNYHNITQGFSGGLAADKSPSPFKDYGYGE